MVGAGSLPCQGGQMLQGAAQRGHGVAILGGFQSLTEQTLEQPGLNSALILL